MTIWLHGVISRTEAQKRLLASEHKDETGAILDGVFLVRRKPQSGGYVISVTYQGRDTHHLVRLHGARSFIINNNPNLLVEGTSITEVIETLSQPDTLPNWPVVLKYPVPAPTPEEAFERHVDKVQQSQISDEGVLPPRRLPQSRPHSPKGREASGSGASSSNSSSRVAAGSAASGEGNADPSTRGANTHEASVSMAEQERNDAQQDPPPHATMVDEATETEDQGIDADKAKTKLGTGAESDGDSIQLEDPDAGRHEDDGEEGDVFFMEDTSRPARYRKPRRRLSEVEAAIKIQSMVRMHQTRRRASEHRELTISAVVMVQAVTKGFLTRQRIKTGRIDVRRPWLHGHISRAEAEMRVTDSPGGAVDGKYLVRPRPKCPGEYVLLLVCHGKFTHHLIKPGPDGGIFFINKHNYGPFRTLDDVVYALRDMDAMEGWPVPLREYVQVPPDEVQDTKHLVAGRVLRNHRLLPISEELDGTIQSADDNEGGEAAAVEADQTMRSDEQRLDGPNQEQQQQQQQQQQHHPRSAEVSVIADRYMQTVRPRTRWKCGACGSYNDLDASADESAQRQCTVCQAVRASRRGNANDILTQGRSPRSPPQFGRSADVSQSGKKERTKHVDPAKQKAREELGQLLKELPVDYRVTVAQALQAFLAGQADLGVTVRSLTAVLQKLDSSTRVAIERNIGILLPSSAREEYDVLLRRARKEEHLDMLIRQTSDEEYEALRRLVVHGIAKWRKQAPPTEESHFERTVNDASVRRGWATIRWQADDPSLSHFDVELVAKEIHTGWARAVRMLWDPKLYGQPMHTPLRVTAHGLLDSTNFQKALLFRAYQSRMALAARPYLVDDSLSSLTMGTGPPLEERMKLGYRVAAEILINAFRSRFEEACRGITTLRVDQHRWKELLERGVIRHPRQAEMASPVPRSQHRPQALSPQPGPPSYDDQLRRGGNMFTQPTPPDFGFMF